jgi:diacylglycerol kinase (ATP)
MAIVQLFANPASGSYSAPTIAAIRAAFEALGAEVRLVHSTRERPEIDADATHVVIAAGDGTVRHVASAAARGGQDVVLGIYPIGTINLLAMEGDYPADPAAFARHMLHGTSRRMHYPVRIEGDDYFFACASVGPDSSAIARLSMPLKRRIGRLAYLAAFCGTLRGWRRETMLLDADGERITCEAFYVAKGRHFAGRWTFAPSAGVEQPLLHVVALAQARRRDFAAFAWALFRGADPAVLKGVRRVTCRTLSATSAYPAPFQADGDIVARLPVTMMVCEECICFR